MSNQQRFNGNRALGRRVSGFTLIELMIVVGVIAVLAAMAYASYQNSVISSRRKAATVCLLEQAQFMERWYTTRMTYDGTNPLPNCETELAASYTFSNPDASATATTYTITATPVGHQLAKDTTCGTLGLNQVGTRTETGTGTPASCW